MSSLLYNSWSLEDVKSYGKKFKARCIANYSYEHVLTIGEIYIPEVEREILPMSPLCSFKNDRGLISNAHLTRFEKIEEIKDNG